MNVLIIGGGNMGRSFAESFLNAKVLTHKQLTVIEKDHAQIQELNRMKLGQVYNDYGDFILEKDIIILATKPQDAYAVYPKLKPFITDKHIVLTIMAGVQIADVENNLATKKVIRCMPNLPCQIGMGVTGFMVSESIPQRDADFVRKLLETTLDALGLAAYGPVGIDLLYDASTQAWTVIEVNARCTSSLVGLAQAYRGELALDIFKLLYRAEQNRQFADFTTSFNPFQFRIPRDTGEPA